MSDAESLDSTANVLAGNYAPSPNTSSLALNRANQLRVQALMRQLLQVNDDDDKQGDDRRRIDTLRVLRKTLKQFHYHLSWLTQVDFLETIERILRDESATCDWRLINDCIQLLIESWPRLLHEIDQQTVEQIVPNIVQNLGHERSEVRRASLLFLNLLLNEKNQPAGGGKRNQFKLIMRLFIDHGLANYRHEQAQRGSILSLPLLINEQTIEGEDLQPLVSCLSDLLVGSNEQLFYSLYLALQRLHLMLGDEKFNYYLRQCEPEAYLLYRQAASRNNSVSVNSGGERGRRKSSAANEHPKSEPIQQQQQVGRQSSEHEEASEQQSKQVTFENDTKRREEAESVAEVGLDEQQAHNGEGGSESPSQSEAESPVDDQADKQGQQVDNQGRALLSSSLSSTSPASSILNGSDDDDEAALFTSEQREIMNQQTDNSSSQTNDNQATAASTRSQVSSVSSTCSSDAHLVNPSHYMNAAALHGRPLQDYERIHHVDHSNISSLAINDLGPVCNTPTMEFGGPLGYGGQSELKFGIFQRHLVLAALNSQSYSTRLEAMQEMMCIVRESPINHLAILMTYFDEFLEQFLARLMQQGQDYKLELIAIDMIETIVIKTKVSTMRYVRPLVNLLVKTLGDSRSIFKDNSVRVIHKMMAYLPPQHVVDAIFEHKHNKSVIVREESINRVTAAVLEYDKNEFNLTKLCFHVLPMLADQHANVRLASLECIATLAHALGPERIGSLLTAAEAVQTGCDYDGLLDAINARLMRHQLPRCNQDGSIRYVIKPFLGAAGQHHEQEAADVRWVLEAPSSHQHPGMGPYYHPHQHHQHQQQVHTEQEPRQRHQHHRLGVYSPPDTQSRRRRSSLGLLVTRVEPTEGPTGGHAHHHPNHHSDQQRAPEEDRHKSEQSTRQAPKSSRNNDDDDEHIDHHRSRSCRRDSCRQPDDESRIKNAPTTTTTTPKAAGEHSKRSSTLSEKTLSAEQQESARETRKQSQVNCRPVDVVSGETQTTRKRRQDNLRKARRSDSQDSLSSTDTNKFLFQYYLEKFKQSLSDSGQQQHQHQQTPALPSDSIIYTDIGLAYDLSRHQSRHQQTSFDYEPHSVGRVHGSSLTPSSQVGPTRTFGEPQEVSEQANKEPLNECNLKRSPSGATSGSESPQTVMEASSSRQNPRRQSSQQQQQQQDSTSRKSSAGEPKEQPDSRGTRGESRRQSVSNVDQEERPQAHQRRKSVVSSRRGSPTDQDQQQAQTPDDRNQQTPKRRNLVRQSASESSQRQGQPQQQQQQARQRSQGSLASKGEPVASTPPPAISRQESNTTTVSESNGSQRSDLVNQRTSDSSSGQQPHEPPSEGRHHRKHRSSRRRSSTRKRKQSTENEETSGQQGTTTTDAADEENDSERRELRRRASRSQPPPVSRRQPAAQPTNISRPASRSHDQHDTIKAQSATCNVDPRRACSVSPSLASSLNIRHILENVAEVEGPFPDPQLALKVAMDALDSPCWSTKVEGLLALVRLATYHDQVIAGHLHEIVCKTVDETRNLRSTVARSAIFALGDYCVKLKRLIEPESDIICQALLQKSTENTAFIRDDIRKALGQMVDNLTHWRLANSLINHGSNHKSMHVRRMTSQFVALLVERMGAAKCLVGAKDISAQVIPAAAKFAQDSSPHTRYYGRLILSRLMQHGAFERLMRRNLAPNLYRSSLGIIESVRRRGPGDPPADS